MPRPLKKRKFCVRCSSFRIILPNFPGKVYHNNGDLREISHVIWWEGVRKDHGYSRYWWDSKRWFILVSVAESIEIDFLPSHGSALEECQMIFLCKQFPFLTSILHWFASVCLLLAIYRPIRKWMSRSLASCSNGSRMRWHLVQKVSTLGDSSTLHRNSLETLKLWCR